MSSAPQGPQANDDAMRAIKFMAVKALLFAGIPAVAALIAAVYILN